MSGVSCSDPFCFCMKILCLQRGETSRLCVPQEKNHQEGKDGHTAGWAPDGQTSRWLRGQWAERWPCPYLRGALNLSFLFCNIGASHLKGCWLDPCLERAWHRVSISP